MFIREILLYCIPSKRGLSEAILLDRRPRERVLELAFVVTIIGLLVAVALQDFRLLASKLQMLEAASRVRTHQIEAAALNAVTGRSPDAVGLEGTESKPLSRNLSSVEFRDDELVFTLSARAAERLRDANATQDSDETAPMLGFRAARAPESGHVIWLCGTRNPPAGFDASPARHTTLPAGHALHFCRPSPAGDGRED